MSRSTPSASLSSGEQLGSTFRLPYSKCRQPCRRLRMLPYNSTVDTVNAGVHSLCVPSHPVLLHAASAADTAEQCMCMC
jgi:hypothetical protein